MNVVQNASRPKEAADCSWHLNHRDRVRKESDEQFFSGKKAPAEVFRVSGVLQSRFGHFRRMIMHFSKKSVTSNPGDEAAAVIN